MRLKNLLAGLASSVLLLLSALSLSAAAYNFTNNPTTLTSNTNLHPKLFFNTNSIYILQTNLFTGGNPGGIPPYTNNVSSNSPYYAAWNNFVAMAESQTHVIPYTYSNGPIALNTGGPGGTNDTDNLWERNVGQYLEYFAAGYAVTASTNAYDDIWIEAEEPIAPMATPIKVATSPNRSGGAYLAVNDIGANTNTIATPSASYTFATTTKKPYYIWALVSPSLNTDYFWWNVDNTGTNNSQAMLSTNANGWFEWKLLGTNTLAPGTHQLNYTYGTQRDSIDKFFISDDPTYAGATDYPGGSITNHGVEQHWIKTSAFTLNNANMGLDYDDELARGQMNLTNASGSLCGLSYLAGSGAANDTPPTGTNADAQFPFFVGTTTNYDIWARVEFYNAGEDSFYYYLNPSGTTGNYHQIGNTTHGPWQWVAVTNSVSLTAGVTNTLALSKREPGAKIDTFAVLPAGSPVPVDPNPFLVAADAWTLAACNYAVAPAKWGKSDTAPDLSSGQLLFGISMVYDQCYSQLTTNDLHAFANTLSVQGSNTFNNAPAQSAYTQYLQNHLWIMETGLTAAALAMYGDTNGYVPGTTTLNTWMQQGLSQLGGYGGTGLGTFNAMGTDGASQEGPGYFEYGIEWLMKYIQMATDLEGAQSGTNTMWSVPWMQNTANYRVHLNLPPNAWDETYDSTTGSDINLADSDRKTWDGPSYILRGLAANTTNAVTSQNAQWLAEQIEEDGLDAEKILLPSNSLAGSALYLNLVWYKPSIPATNAPTTTFMPFNDLGYVVSRTGWSTNNESVVTYQCGPFMGTSVNANNTSNPYVDWGAAHIHPEANNFSVFGDGNWLIRNDAYVATKLTQYGNTLQVNNAGQMGEGAAWFDPSVAGPSERTNPPTFVTNNVIYQNGTNYNTSAWLDYMAGDAAGAYSNTADLTKFKRHLLFLKHYNVLVVVDDIAQSVAQPLELRFFTEAPPTAVSGVAGGYTTTNTSAIMAFNVLTTNSVTMTTSNLSMPKTGGIADTNSFIGIKPATSTNGWTNAVAMSWQPTNTSPYAVSMIQDGMTNAIKFRVNNNAVNQHTIVLNRGTNDETAQVLTTIEAESVVPNTPVVRTNSTPGASGGEYIAAPLGTPENSPDTLTNASAVYTFTVPVAGTYELWARMYGADGNSDSFWYAMNPTNTGQTYTNEGQATVHGSWQWVDLGPQSLTNGGNYIYTLGFKYREANAQVDQFIITSAPTNVWTPSGTY